MTDEDVWIDYDGDGAGDSHTTEDLGGDEGTAYISESGDVAIDQDNDGYIDQLYTDEDGDGEIDTVMEDTDGDGYVDTEESYEGDPLADDEAKGEESGSDGEKSEGESGSSGDSGGSENTGGGGLDGLFS